MFTELPIISATTRLPDVHPAKLEYDRYISYANEPLCNLSFDHPTIGTCKVQGFDIFDCLWKLRKLLHEQHNVYLLCAGSRIDAYSAGAMRNMSGGRFHYIHTFGKYPTRLDEVKIFDAATPEQVGSVEEQLHYHKEWLKSVSTVR